MTDIVIGKDDFAEELAKRLSAELIKTEEKTFADGEKRPRLLLKSGNQLKGKNALLAVRSNRYNPSPNDSIVETCLLLKEMKGLGVEEIGLLWPWALYSRQDEKFRPGEPASLKYVAELLESCGVTDFYTVYSHIYKKPTPLTEFFSSDVNVHDISPAKLFVEYFKRKKMKDCIIVTPDEKGEDRIREISEPLNYEFRCLLKTRDHNTGKIKIDFGDLDVRGRDVIIEDDIATSGGTVVDTYRRINRMKPRKVYIALVHLLTLEGIKTLYDLRAEEIVTTNSFVNETKQPKYFTELNLVPLLAEVMK